MYSMEEFGNDFAEFFSGNAFWVTMGVLITYGVGYVKFIQHVAAGDKRNELGEGQLVRNANAMFWQRLRRLDFFAVLYVVDCVAFLVLPFALLILHSRQLK